MRQSLEGRGHVTAANFANGVTVVLEHYGPLWRIVDRIALGAMPDGALLTYSLN